ncbi:MAG: hypothetical protein FJ117_13720 [Deltaproteobacteria bacterium]|nr:hypothetical protein [Deltaproteobacteria bacterium]
MPTIKDFEIETIQTTIFTPGLSFASSRLLASALEKWGNIFDSPPISLPLPPDVPSEVPRIILQSSSMHKKLELAPKRANLFWLRQNETDTIILEDYLHFAADVLCNYVNIVSGKVGRIAAVLNRSLRSPNPGLFLAEHFCKENWLTAPFNRPESFEIHAHKRYSFVNRFNVNSWVRCKTGIAKPDKSIILVEQDINTAAEEMEMKEFSDGEIRDFFRLVNEEFNSILSLYFPGGK